MGEGVEERVTAQPGCGPGGMVGLCLKLLAVWHRRLLSKFRHKLSIPPGTHVPLVTCSSSLRALVYNYRAIIAVCACVPACISHSMISVKC